METPKTVLVEVEIGDGTEQSFSFDALLEGDGKGHHTLQISV